MRSAEILQRRIFLAWQRSIASAQRGAKAQPCGSRVNEGTVPGISASRSLPLVCCVGTAGIEAISPRV